MKTIFDIQPETKINAVNRISYSQFSMYSQCPKHWELSYVKKLRTSQSNMNLVFGTAFHETLQTWLTVLFNEGVKASTQLNIPKMLQDNLSAEYMKRYTEAGTHFSNPAEINEFYEDGIAILDYIIKHRTGYFPSKNYKLIGIEVPVDGVPHPDYPGVHFIGYIDIVVYNELSDIYTLYDIKTSRMGWKDSDKKNKLKASQLVLYKDFFAKKWNIPIDKIHIEFFIVRRKILTETAFPQKRVQHFVPSSGTVTRKKLNKEFLEFISSCFNPDGTYNTTREYPAVQGPKKSNCTYCEFKDNKELCPVKNRLESL